MALLAPSIKGLQTLLNATESYCKQWDILLNAKKTKNMFFGKSVKLPNLVLDGKPIEWVNSWSYLGVNLRSHKNFNCSIDNKVKASYRCADAILRIDGRSDKMVMLHLLETQYISVLTRLKSSTLLTETNVENSESLITLYSVEFLDTASGNP